MKREIEIHHLEMTSPADLRPAGSPGEELEIRQARIPCPELNHFFYTAVGGDWFWIDRLSWTYEQWFAWLDRPELETWIGSVEGTPAGYFELEKQPEGSVELAYFGLLPRFIGRRLGGALLTAAVQRAWGMGASRVWLHTCSLDGPASLANYQARGFRIFKTERLVKDLPDETPGPWPGARREG
ncbi:MAG TPA: GNAT family N-acetyltransferase [Thermoanaerobaculia bacterium]|jgi:GNAT superfamily N-acetyltransferase|nr:GNAT family N-acetyltransferase [Thermoanaerobaculia bacterium]